ncbi:hypothetical protein D3C87_2020130 [compost metagenome]
MQHAARELREVLQYVDGHVAQWLRIVLVTPVAHRLVNALGKDDRTVVFGHLRLEVVREPVPNLVEMADATDQHPDRCVAVLAQ